MSTRFLAVVIAVAGLSTFLWPLVTTDPPIAGITRWSCFNIVVQMYNGALPQPVCERCGEPSIRALLAVPFTAVLDYLFMMVAGVTLGLRIPARVLVWTTLLGGYNCLNLWRIGTRLAFEETFFGFSRNGHVHYGALLSTHLVVFGTLFLAALDLRDEEASHPPHKSSQLMVEPQESPPVIDAEIIEGGEPANGPRRDPPGLHD